MSNKRRLRQLNGGRQTRQRGTWAHHARGPARSPYGNEMAMSANVAAKVLWLDQVGLPRRNDQLGGMRGGGARSD